MQQIGEQEEQQDQPIPGPSNGEMMAGGSVGPQNGQGVDEDEDSDYEELKEEDAVDADQEKMERKQALAWVYLT